MPDSVCGRPLYGACRLRARGVSVLPIANTQENDVIIKTKPRIKPDGCIVWNAHNTVLGEEALLIYIVAVCYVKAGRYGKT